MIKLCLSIGRRPPYRLLLSSHRCSVPQIYEASISTNTAINRSLRRSQYEGNRSQRRQSQRGGEYRRDLLDLPYSSERVRRPNNQQGLDVNDMERHAKINERYRLLKKARTTRRSPQRLKNLVQESVTEGLSPIKTIPSARSQYDYSRKPGGNRATRRAAKFGHEMEPSSEGTAIASNRQVTQRQGLRGDRELYSADPVNYGDSTLEHNDIDGGVSSSRISGGSYRRGFGEGRDLVSRDDDARIPLTLPYTTPASEFLYGTSVVVAALLSSRRKLYKLYIYDGDKREARDQDIRIRKLALDRSVVVERVKGDWLRVMDKMSTGRPHNV